MPKLKEFYFTIDLRSLGLYRVLLAALLVVDWVGCQPNPAAFYAGLVIYLLLLIGYRTRLFQLLSFVFFAGVCDHGDAVLATMLLWSLFLPTGKRFSLDAISAAMRRGIPVTRRLPAPPEVERCEPSLAAFTIVAQIGLTCLFTAVAKSGSAWKGGAVAALILIPWFQPWLRRLAIVTVVALQLAGTLPVAMIAACALVLMPPDWKLFRARLRPVTIYYDDTCGFCHWCAQLLVIADRLGNLRFIGNHDTAAFRHELTRAELESSIVVFDETTGQRTTRAAAAAAILRALPWPFHVFCVIAWPGLCRISDVVYDFVARNRYRFSRWLGFTACGIDRVQEDVVQVEQPRSARVWRRALRVAANLIAAVVFVALLIDGFNRNAAKRLGCEPLCEPGWMRAIVPGLFAPAPGQRGQNQAQESLFHPPMYSQFNRWAIRRNENSIRLHPDNPKVWSKLYGLCLQEGAGADFAAFCQEIVRIHPDNRHAWNFFALAAKETGDPSGLSEFYRQVVELHPNSGRAWTELDQIYENCQDEGDYVAFCQGIASLHAGNLPALTRLAQLYKRQGRHADLLSVCLQILAHKPDDVQAWCNLADAHAATGQYEEAETAYKKAITLKPRFLPAWNSLGNVYHLRGRYDDAVHALQKSIALNPDDASPWVWLCLAYAEMGEVTKAEEAVKKVEKHLPLVAAMLTEALAQQLDDGPAHLPAQSLAKKFTFVSP